MSRKTVLQGQEEYIVLKAPEWQNLSGRGRCSTKRYQYSVAVVACSSRHVDATMSSKKHQISN